jgi:hypothetical protein
MSGAKTAELRAGIWHFPTMNEVSNRKVRHIFDVWIKEQQTTECNGNGAA